MCSSHVSVLRFRVGQERREKDETRDAKSEKNDVHAPPPDRARPRRLCERVSPDALAFTEF